MNITDYLNATLGVPNTHYQKTQATTGASSLNLLGLSPGVPGAISSPGSAAGSALTGATPGALPMPALTSGQDLHLNHWSHWTTQSGFLWLVDLLVMTSELNGTLTTAQTVNSTALPRATSGDGVRLGVIVHTQIGATARTLTINYKDETNADAVATVSIGGTGFRDPAVFIPVNLPTSGIRSVVDATLNLSTGTAGNFGFVLYREVAAMPVTNLLGCTRNFTDLGQPLLYSQGDSSPCLSLIWAASASATLYHVGSVGFAVFDGA